MSVKPDEWKDLKQFTHSRIALGRSGHSIPTSGLLDFKLAHSRARDSVWKEVQFDAIEDFLRKSNHSYLQCTSQCTSKQEYLLNPDLGRNLCDASYNGLQQLSTRKDKNHDCALVLVDGLSSTAIHENALDFLGQFLNSTQEYGLSLAPILLVNYGRVAIADGIGQILKSKSTLVVIGERPGLATADSLSCYFTYGGRQNYQDSDRNCISNIHKNGISPNIAAKMAAYLVKESLQHKLSGVDLKVEYPAILNVNG